MDNNNTNNKKMNKEGVCITYGQQQQKKMNKEGVCITYGQQQQQKTSKEEVCITYGQQQQQKTNKEGVCITYGQQQQKMNKKKTNKEGVCITYGQHQQKTNKKQTTQKGVCITYGGPGGCLPDVVELPVQRPHSQAPPIRQKCTLVAPVVLRLRLDGHGLVDLDTDTNTDQLNILAYRCTHTQY